MSIKYFILFFIFVLSLLAIRFYTFYSAIPEIKDGQEVKILTDIASEPEVKGKTQRFSVQVKSHRIFITTGKYPLYHYGDRIEVQGEVRVSEKDENIFYNLSFPKIRQFKNISNPIIRISLWIRNRAIEIFTSFLSPTQAALLLGIVFGIKQNMPDDFLQILRDAGVVHVIAASGMNVSMIAGSFFSIFQRLFKRRLAIIFSLLGIILYVFIAGSEASIVRASIMAGITFSAGLTGRQKLSIYALFMTAIIMLFINPSWISDVGFQLSFLATLGILIGKPIFDKSIKRFEKLGVLGDDLTTTLAAQLATFPILIANFGTVNLLSVVVNMLVLWTIPILMVIGGISILMGLIFTQLGSFISVFSMPLLMYFEIVVRWFDRFKLPIKLENSNLFIWVGYYVVLISLVISLKKRNDLKKKSE